MNNACRKRQQFANDIIPDFETSDGALAKDYWEDWMRVLSKENLQRIYEVEDDFMDFLTLESVEYIFTVCVRLRTPHEVRYLAALIFEQFMRKLTFELFQFISDSKMSQRKKDAEWAKIETNLSRQVSLRVATSIQLATKDVQYHSSLSSPDVVSILRTLGYAYTQKAILKSELRILSTLDFHLPKSPIVYPESLLKALLAYSAEELGLSEPLCAPSCWDHITLFLDMFFLYHDEYSTTLLRIASPNVDPANYSRKALASLKADYMLLGAGLVAAAISIVHDFTSGELVTPVLSKLSGGVPPVDISEVCITLIEMTKRMNGPSQEEAPAC